MAFSHEDYMAARRRRLETNAMIARSDPGRFSSFERNALLGMQHTKVGDIAYVDRSERAGLRQHEMDMLKQRGENEFKVAEQKRFGMKEQGSDAAQWAFKGKEVEAKAGLTKAEIDAASKTKIAELDAEAKKYGADRGLEAAESQHGYFDDKGVYHPGGNVAAAEARGKTALEAEGIRGQATVDAARAQAEAAAARQNGQNSFRSRENRENRIQRAIGRLQSQPQNRNKTLQELRRMAELQVDGEDKTGGGLARFRK